ncbi:MAG: hypothetical protein P8183_16630 [Anaerolineae bacterium]
MGDAASTSSAGAESTNRLRLISPDPHTIYRISPALPLSAQKLRFEAVTAANLSQITLWLDGEPLATLTEPPFEAWWPLSPGQHTAWADGLDSHGNQRKSSTVTFEVRDAADD